MPKSGEGPLQVYVGGKDVIQEEGQKRVWLAQEFVLEKQIQDTSQRALCTQSIINQTNDMI